MLVTRSVKVRRIAGDGLAGRRSRQQPHVHGKVLEPWNQFFNAHAGDVNLRQRGTQVSVPFVRADNEPARFGDCEIDTRDANFSGQELASQVFASRFGQVFRVVGPFVGAQFFVEELTDLCFFDEDLKSTVGLSSGIFFFG